MRLHQIDCCGSIIAIGIATTATATFDPAEAACMASYPECGCAARAPITDSGETFFDTDLVHAACVGRGPGNVCLTYVAMRPPKATDRRAQSPRAGETSAGARSPLTAPGAGRAFAAAPRRSDPPPPIGRQPTPGSVAWRAGTRACPSGSAGR